MKVKVNYEYSAHVTETEDGLVIHGILFPGLTARTLQMFQEIRETPVIWEALAALHRLPGGEQEELCKEELK